MYIIYIKWRECDRAMCRDLESAHIYIYIIIHNGLGGLLIWQSRGPCAQKQRTEEGCDGTWQIGD